MSELTPSTGRTCDTPDYCRRVEVLYGYNVRHLTARESTPDERMPGGVGFWLTGAPMAASRYVVVDVETGAYLGGFGMADGGDTREEAVYWADRWASKNGGHFLRPEGWEGIVGDLPDEEGA